MADADRPGSAEAPPRLRAVRGGGRRRPARSPAEAGDFGRRLAALERQVEEALGAGSAGVERLLGLATAADGALAVYAGARRWLASGPATTVATRSLDLTLDALVRWWWRVEPLGLERLPDEGPVLVVVNRAGFLVPWDLLAVTTVLAAAQPAGRHIVPIVDDWALTYPLLGPLLGATGAVPATPSRLRGLARCGVVAVTALEGPEACARPWSRRYRVGPLRRTALVRAAIATGTPIVPVAIVGTEEAHPVLGRVDALARPLGLPSFPLTPTFPWLGLGGLVPLPTRWTLRAGEPLDLARRFRPDAAHSGATVREVTAQVRERLQALVSEGLRRRRSLFF